MKKNQGYILPLTLMIISMAVILVTSVIQRAMSYQRQARLMLDREQARNLALSSLEIALSKICLVVPKGAPQEKEQAAQAAPAQAQQKEEAQKKEGWQKPPPMQQWLLQILPVLNKWQTIELTEKEGITGTLSFYISSEQGKISLEHLSTLLESESKQKQQAAQAAQQQAPPQNGQQSNAQQPGQTKNLLTVFDELIKKEMEVSIRQVLKEAQGKYKRPLEDFSELVPLKSFTPLKDKLFVTRPTAQQQRGKQQLFVTDLFTTASSSGTLNPWLLSNSLKAILGFKENKEVKINKEFVKDLKPTMNWQTEWDKILAPFYGKKFANIPQEIRALFGAQFEATAFFVVSYAQVGGVTQKVAALLEVTEPPAYLSPKSIIFKVSKLYWL